MLSIPSDLLDDATRFSHSANGYTIVDYLASSATVGLHVVVTQPTIVFIHEGLKELSSGPNTATIGVPAGNAVAMRSGTHVMSDLLPQSTHYQSTIISVGCETLRSLVGAVELGDGAEQATAVTLDSGLRELAKHLPLRLRSTSNDVEQTLAIKEVLVSTLLHRPLRETLAADLAGWGSSVEHRVKAIMGRHCYSPLSIPQYASLCAMSVSTFKRRFRDAYGMAPGRWLLEARLAYAARLLATDALSVTDICTASGFGDLSNFTRSFNGRFGMSPTTYRSTAGQIGQVDSL